MITEGVAELTRARIHYVEGAGTGPAVVLIHGLTDGLEAYLPILDAIRGEAHAFALDLRGHGESSRTPGAYRIIDYAVDIEEFLHEVVRQPAFLVGCSLGALVACCVAARREAAILGILLEDPPLYVGQMPDLRETLFYTFYEFLTRILPEHRRTNGTVDDLLETFRHPLVSEELQRVLAKNLHRLDLDAVRPAMEGTLFDLFDPDEELPKIRCPVRVIVARGDPAGDAVRDRDIDRMTVRIRRFSYVCWRDTIHAIHYQRPTEVTAEIRAFVAEAEKMDPKRSRNERNRHGQGA